MGQWVKGLSDNLSLHCQNSQKCPVLLTRVCNFTMTLRGEGRWRQGTLQKLLGQLVRLTHHTETETFKQGEVRINTQRLALGPRISTFIHRWPTCSSIHEYGHTER